MHFSKPDFYKATFFSNSRQGLHSLKSFISIALISSAMLFPSVLRANNHNALLQPETKTCFLQGLAESAQCGELEVPEDYQRPDGKKITLAFAIIPAIKSIPGNAPLLAIAGGPGQSAIENARLFAQIFYRTRQDRDLILVDQRGTGQSNQLQCDNPDQNNLALDDQNQDIAKLANQCLQELADRTANLPRYGSLDALKDLEQVRNYLQIPSWHIYGISYGTRMAQLYMRHYPKVIETVTLDGVVPMQQSVITIGSAINRAFEQVIENCADDPACQRQYPELKLQLEHLSQQLAHQPEKVQVFDPVTAQPETFLVTQNKFLGSLRMAMYTPSVRTMIPLIIDQAAKGNFQPLLGLYGSSGDNGIALGMHMVVACGEDWPRLTSEQANKLKNSSKIAAETIKLFEQACPIWKIPPVADDFANAIGSDIPTLLLSGNLDPATPPSWAELARVKMTNNRHFIAPYATHGVAFQSCAPLLIEQLIEEKSLENLDQSCLKKDTRRDFFLNANGRSLSSTQAISESEKPGHQPITSAKGNSDD